MYSILAGSLLLSLLHAIIPSHWLPVLAIGRKEQWDLKETERVTLIAGLAHVLSTIIIGALLGLISREISMHIERFTQIVAPSVLILVGLYFVRQHYVHHHFHLENHETKGKQKSRIIGTLFIAMFLSPCLEIEAYFILAGTKGWWMIVLIALMYAVVTISGMLLWIKFAYKGLLKLNWHRWEHSTGLISGCVLIVTGILSFFIY